MTPEEAGRTPGRLKTILLSLVVLAGAAAVVAVIFRTEPEATRSGARKRTAMMVEVTEVERKSHKPTLRATGTVRAEQDVVLRAQVGGEIKWRADEFTPGGFVAKRKPLVRIDSRDYQNMVAQAESTVKQAKTELQIELGRQDAAKKGYELLGETVDDSKKALVLRKPQLEATKVRIQAAEAALRQARLDLERTTIRAPFDAHILERNVNVGSRVTAGDPVARVVGVNHYWIEVTVPLSHMRWLSFTDEDAVGSTATVRNRGSWPAGSIRKGTVDRRIGALNESTRMARVLVTVSDPLARDKEAAGQPALVIGEFLEVELEGAELPDSVRIDRDLLRDKDTVWVMKDGMLDIRSVEIALQTSDHAYITKGLEDGDKLITTNLSAVRDGAELRLKGGE